MTKPWELHQGGPVERPADTRTTFIVFCEDEAVEPSYFRRFSNDQLQVSAIANQGQHHDNVDNATQYCREQGMLDIQKGMSSLQLEDGPQVWCVFDRDKSAGDGKDASFDNSIQSALGIGMKVAWSNDDFELWILLHLEEVPSSDPDYHHRDKYYERLTAYLKSLTSPTEELARLTSNPRFGYKHTMKTSRRFITEILPLLNGKLDDALNRSNQLHRHFAAQSSLPYHKWMPCTQVGSLVQALLDAGGNRY